MRYSYPSLSAAAHVSGSDPTGLLGMKRWVRMWKAHRSMEAIRDRDDEIRERLGAQDRAGRPIVRDALVSRIGNERFHKATERQLPRRVRALATRWTGRSNAAKRPASRVEKRF